MPILVVDHLKKEKNKRKRPIKEIKKMKKSSIKKLIRNILKEQNVSPGPVSPSQGDSGPPNTMGKRVTARPCDHSPNGYYSTYPIMQNMTIDGLTPQVGDIFFHNAHGQNLSGNGISGGQQSIWEVTQVNDVNPYYSNTYDRPGSFCGQSIWGGGGPNAPPAASNGDRMAWKCFGMTNAGMSDWAEYYGGCHPVLFEQGQYNTPEECMNGGTVTAPTAGNFGEACGHLDADDDGAIDDRWINQPKKTPVKPSKAMMNKKGEMGGNPLKPDQMFNLKEQSQINYIAEQLHKKIKKKKRK